MGSRGYSRSYPSYLGEFRRLAISLFLHLFLKTTTTPIKSGLLFVFYRGRGQSPDWHINMTLPVEEDLHTDSTTSYYQLDT